VIKLTKVFKAYPKGVLALRDVSFHISKAEFSFLTGHSGAGKSTVLKLIYADDLPTEGEVRVSGFVTRTMRRSEVPRLRRRLGIVFQDFRLLDHRTAEENIAFALEVTGARRSVIGPKVARVLAQVGLAAKARAYPHELSGGEQQRVAIARAVANQPKILLADEPTGNLDAATGAGVIDLMFELNAQARTTLLLVTHDEAIAARCARKIRLVAGRIDAD